MFISGLGRTDPPSCSIRRRLANLRYLIDAGAKLNLFDPVHQSSPLGWAVHGARFTGGAEDPRESCVAIVRALLEAGSPLCCPEESQGNAYFDRLLGDAVLEIVESLRVHAPS